MILKWLDRYLFIYIEMLADPPCIVDSNIGLVCLSHSCIILSKSFSVMMPALPLVSLAQSLSSGAARSNKEQNMPTSIIRQGCMCGVTCIFNLQQIRNTIDAVRFVSRLMARSGFISICPYFSRDKQQNSPSSLKVRITSIKHWAPKTLGGSL